MSHHEVIVIGGGPAGLACATELARHGVRPLMLERESEAGGIPRHCHHSGFGIRDLRRSMSGPAYAERNSAAAADAGVEIRTCSMVTSFDTDRSMWGTSPAGREQLTADAVVLATGARERPRAARLVAGDRPRGVYTTGQLQILVHLHGRHVGERALVVGAELVSWSAVMTLRDAGCRVVRVLAQSPTVETYGLVRTAAPLLFRSPLSRAKVVEIHGRARVESVTVEHFDDGRREIIDCDTVVFTGDWIPDHELARMAGVILDAGSLGPQVDAAGRTSVDGVFAVGNLVHPVDTADVAALGGRHVATGVLELLGGAIRPQSVPIEASSPLRWVSPAMVTGESPSRGRYLAAVDRQVNFPTVRLVQDGAEGAHTRLPWAAAPGRIFRIPERLFRGVDPAGGAVTVSID